MDINRRSFLKVSSGVIASLLLPVSLVKKIPITKEILENNDLIWTADSNWGTITYVGVYDKKDNLIYMAPVDRVTPVSKGDTASLDLNLEVELKEGYSVGLFSDTEEISGKGYTRKKL
jgi:hypothetical protein